MSDAARIDPEMARRQAIKAEIVRLKRGAPALDIPLSAGLDDAKRALGCLADVLCHVGEGQLDCLDPENLAGFIRLVLAQFPAN